MTQYGQTEERLNILSHGIGVLLSIVALLLLMINASGNANTLHIFSALVYTLSSIILYAASTFYHSRSDTDFREKMESVDHAAIFILIAGSYTPFALVVVKGWFGWMMFAIAWSLAIGGVIFKLTADNKYKMISLGAYVLMGSISLLFIDPIVDNLSYAALMWLGIGGVFYLIGAFLYGLKPFKYNHPVFHTFILFGTISHFIAVYFYVLP